jgi:hypothetical protein
VTLWVNAFTNDYTNEQVIAGFAGAQEFYASSGGTPQAWLDQAVLDMFGTDGF